MASSPDSKRIIGVAEPTGRVMERCSNCGYTKAEDFPVTTREITKYDYWGKPYKAEEKRLSIRGHDPFNDPIICPNCGKRRLKANEVRGRLDPKIKCGSKCTGAQGPNCDCSCGGENHGKSYL